ncbi:glycosyl hydrolase [Sphingomonas sp. LR60]|uniref:glycosyl hydrolase n=1 Tax=Sphingomonas sp. LR60 TaxID=3050233 RepID=UPI002FE13AEF
MLRADIIDHPEKIGIGTYPIYGLDAMIGGVDALHAAWFYTWAAFLPREAVSGWSIGAAAALAGDGGDRELRLDGGADGWAIQDIGIAGDQSLTLRFAATGASGSGGIVLDYLDASGRVVGGSYVPIDSAGGSFTLDAITPAGTTSARLIAYADAGGGFALDDVSVRVGAVELLKNGDFDRQAPTTATTADFVPMVWGAADMMRLAEVAATASPVLLTFNEPDDRHQANMSVEQALKFWPALMETGKRLGSPATTINGALGEKSWLGRFMAGAEDAGYRVDFVAVHYYSADPSVTAFRTFLENVHAAYGKPVWVTEWSLADWTNEGRFSAEQQQAFFVAATRMMDDLSFVERQSWFAAYEGLDQWDLNTGLLNADGSLTALGEQFVGLAAAAPAAAIPQTLIGTAANDSLTGGDGDDWLDGGAGNNRLIGGLGDDVYVVDQSGDVVIELPGEGHDTIRTSLRQFSLAARGEAVEDLIYTGAGSFIGTGNALDNTITGGAGADILDGGAGNDVLRGGAGNDVYYVDSTADQVIENEDEGADKVISTVSFALDAHIEKLTLVTAAGFVRGDGNALSNIITGSATAANELHGGGGNDRLDGGSLADWLYGDAGNDDLRGGDGDDMLFGGDGNDKLYGDDGMDLLFGEDSADLLYGGAGDDRLDGGKGSDKLYGGEGNDLLDGGDDNDLLDGGAGSDVMIGGAGNDTYIVDDSRDQVVEFAGGGTDTVKASGSFTLADEVENLLFDSATGVIGIGNALANRIVGSDGGDQLFGMAGNDTIYGGAGDDTLDGGEGADVLSGGLGANTLIGGAGADKFVFASLAETIGDRIVDFSHAERDRIDLSQIDAIAGTARNDAFRFIGSAEFGHIAGELRAAALGDGWIVQGDVDGDGTADLTIALVTIGSAALVGSDFIL